MIQARARVPVRPIEWRRRKFRNDSPIHYLIVGRDFYEIGRGRGYHTWFMFKNHSMFFGIALSLEEGKAMCEEEARHRKLASRNTVRFWEKSLAFIPTTIYIPSTRADMGRAALEYFARRNRYTVKESPMASAVAKPAPRAAAVPAKKPATPAPAPKPVAAAAPAPAPAPEPKAPKRSPISATDEEIKAAQEGTLEPRETPTAEALAATENGRPIGVTTGLPIAMGWCFMFQNNENLPTNEKWTDEMISQWMHSEYPGRETKAFDQVGNCRVLYNGGRFTKSIPPKVKSQRYDENGAPIARGPKVAAEAAPEAVAPAPAPAAPAKPKKVVKA